MTNIENKKFNFKSGITHSGVFHADEIFATAMLRKIDPDFSVTRTFKVADPVDENILVYDIGGGKFDHHQKGGNGSRENGIPFASFGLLWKEFGALIVADERVRNLIDRDLVAVIDAFDNGYAKVESNLPAGCLPVSSLISGFNPTWDSEKSSDEAFEDALQIASVILDNTIKSSEAKIKASSIVEEAIAASKNIGSGKVIYLPRVVPWQEAVISSISAADMLYVVYPTLRRDWACQAIPDALGSFGKRKELPKAWGGAPVEELRRLTGVEDAIFCHPGLFMCSASSKEGAAALAELAVSA